MWLFLQNSEKSMKILMLLSVVLFLACSKEPHEYTMDEVYRDYYVQKKIESQLSFQEKDLLDRAEQRYIAMGKKNQFSKMTINDIINEQKKFNDVQNIINVTTIKITDKSIIQENNNRYIQWKILIYNKSNKAITKVQGWINIIDLKSKEILRTDVIDSDVIIKKNGNIVIESIMKEFDISEKANNIIKDAKIEELNKMIVWHPTLIIFADSTELTDIRN
jgi:hypothetical protein